MADKFGVAFLSEASLLEEEEEEEDPLVVKALMGLANAQPQLLPLPSSTAEETQAEEDDEVTAKPPKIPPHRTLSFMQWFTAEEAEEEEEEEEAEETEATTLCFPSR